VLSFDLEQAIARRRKRLSTGGEQRGRPDRSGPVGGVVLAAGSSTRMGKNKLLFDLGGEPVVRRAVRTALAAGLDPIVVVLGHEADAVRAALASLPCRFVVNPRHAEGMNSSVSAGIAALPLEVAAGVVLLSDMPFVSARMITALVDRHRAGDALLVFSEYDGVQAPPTLFDRSLFVELAGPEGKGCGKTMRRRHPGRDAIVVWPATALADLDVPEDYARAKAQLG
jgi:molybdenum cofactor cytidylyltransferase